MKIQVRKCGFTGDLFESDQQYLAHLIQLRKQYKKRRERDKITRNWHNWLQNSQAHVLSVKDLEQWLNDHQHEILVMSQHLKRTRTQTRGIRLGFKFENIQWSHCVSNSHSCPRDGVTNWHMHSHKPRGYPGWQGRIEITGWEKFDGFVSNLLEIVDIHTGTGGCGGYEVRWYASDWPGMHMHQTLMQG